MSSFIENMAEKARRNPKKIAFPEADNGVIQPIIQLVGAAGPAFFALVAGATGSYKIPYICGAVVMAIGLIAFVTLAKPGFVKKEEEKVNGGQN